MASELSLGCLVVNRKTDGLTSYLDGLFGAVYTGGAKGTRSGSRGAMFGIGARVEGCLDVSAGHVHR